MQRLFLTTTLFVLLLPFCVWANRSDNICLRTLLSARTSNPANEMSSPIEVVNQILTWPHQRSTTLKAGPSLLIIKQQMKQAIASHQETKREAARLIGLTFEKGIRAVENLIWSSYDEKYRYLEYVVTGDRAALIRYLQTLTPPNRFQVQVLQADIINYGNYPFSKIKDLQVPPISEWTEQTGLLIQSQLSDGGVVYLVRPNSNLALYVVPGQALVNFLGNFHQLFPDNEFDLVLKDLSHIEDFVAGFDPRIAAEGSGIFQGRVVWRIHDVDIAIVAASALVWLQATDAIFEQALPTNSIGLEPDLTKIRKCFTDCGNAPQNSEIRAADITMDPAQAEWILAFLKDATGTRGRGEGGLYRSVFVLLNRISILFSKEDLEELKGFILGADGNPYFSTSAADLKDPDVYSRMIIFLEKLRQMLEPEIPLMSGVDLRSSSGLSQFLIALRIRMGLARQSRMFRRVTPR